MDVEPFLVALAIGLLLGFERERSHIRTLPAGSRSFALLSLAGAVAAGFDIWAVSAGIVVVGLLMALAYLRTSEQDAGTTTEIAALVAYLLGALAYTDPSVAVALSVIVAGLLMSKYRIHRFARQMVSEIELEDAIKFLVAAFVILPLLPDREIGPYGVLNPAKVWLLVVLLTGIGWIGYIGVRTLGPQRGLLVTGLAGGFVSASATTASMGRLSRTADEMRAPLAGALVASLATFIQLLVVIGFVEPDVLRRLWPPVVAGAMVLVVVAAIVYRGASVAPRDAEVISVGVEPNTAARPFSLRPALVLAAVLVFALFVGRWGADVLGSRGAVLAAAAAGLADAHAGALGAASLAAKGTITVDSALQAIAAALGSNLLVKSVLAFTSGGHRFGLGFLAAMALPTVVFAVVMTFVVTMG
ncbi:MgtC/SapB family protein [Rhodococcus fascians]|nr:MgtC/SapB family protein [Rhodococcus fascians]MBY4039672.1 MgtC/SapB family protein [Rhodococcus fascians]MBY4056222.1 MgtC/SapB family protein [Rhodococcus fascians]MBY4068669.1 MgtC/SapB family protein [Rhodococcus fascians]MBY4137738.1 MgtC/SapB family protein [Rhodococcus fascians]